MPHMRILLAMIFLTPIVPYAAIQSGAEQITPYLLGMALAGVAAQIFVERRKARS